MSDSNKPQVGTILWTDLTVPDAEAVRDFYSAVVGWKVEPVGMGDYSDFNMVPPAGEEGVVGICHARGPNVGLPAQWLIYISVEDVEQSAAQCVRLGGKVLAGPKDMGDGGRYCVIQDPAGAVAALYSGG